MEPGDLWKLAVLFICVALSAFFSASETAFIALSRVRLMHQVHIGKPGAGLVSRLIQRPDSLLATVLLGNNLVNTAAAALATAIAISLIDNGTMAVLVSTAGTTVVLLVFGETIPKTLAWWQAEPVAFGVSRPLAAVGWLLSPLVHLLQMVAVLVRRIMGVASVHSHVTEEEIRTMISVGAQAGAVESTEADLLQKIFRFGDQLVHEVMTPRPDIVWVEHGATLKEFLALYLEYNHTRYPVYEGTTETVIGILSVKDVMTALGKDDLSPEASVTTLLRPVHFVPETKTVANTFTEMQREGHNMVLAVDEFGGIAGLFTLKRLLEVIVGQVAGEGETPGEEYVALDENTYLVDAGVSVLDINEKLQLDLPEGDYQTVAGFVLDRLGRIPEEGEMVQHNNLQLTVKTMDEVRIDQLEIRRLPEAREEEQ